MSRELTVEEWVRERLDNCHRIAIIKVGDDREGWLEDARYFQRILTHLASRSDAATREELCIHSHRKADCTACYPSQPSLESKPGDPK